MFICPFALPGSVPWRGEDRVKIGKKRRIGLPLSVAAYPPPGNGEIVLYLAYMYIRVCK